MSTDSGEKRIPPAQTTAAMSAAQGESSGQKAVTIFDEPEHIAPPDYGEQAPGLLPTTSPKLHRASISGKKMTGRPPVQPLGSPSLSRTLSSLNLYDGGVADSTTTDQRPGTPDGKALFAQVAEWLSQEKTKRAFHQPNYDSTKPSLPATETDIDLEKLERILAGFGSAVAHAEPKPTKRFSTANVRRGSLLKKFRRQSTYGASSDTEWIGDDINVPHVEASLDNSKTMAYTGGEADDSSGDVIRLKEQKHWDQFKQDIVRLTHTLRIRGWRRIPIEKGATICVERLSGALTNAVYVVRPPAQLPEPDGSADGSRSYVPKSKPMELLLRIYGPQVEHLIDREDELLILRRLAKKKIGPRLLGYFTNGRFEEFLRAKTLTAEDLRVPETSKQIAKRMRELHDGIELLPSEVEAGPRAFLNLEKWLDRCEKVMMWLDDQVKMTMEGKKPVSKRYTRRGFICGVEWPVLRKTFEKYRQLLIEDHGGHEGVRKRLVFAHNDTQYGNLMRLNPPGESPLLQPANQHRQLIVIDFEYASANTPGYEFANHFTEWCYNYHHAEASFACNTNWYPTPAEQHRFVRAYVMHRPQFASSASATPKMEAREKTNISDFMLDARTPGAQPAIDYDAEEREREEKVELDIKMLLHETRMWRILCSMQWAAWGIVQAKVPEFDEPSKSKISRLVDKMKGHLSVQSDPLDADVKALQEAAKHDRPEGREQEEAHAEGDGAESEEEAEEFDYLSYAHERFMFFWGDCLQLGIVQESELPESLLKQVKMVKF